MSRAPSSSQNLQNSQAHSCFWLLALTWMKAPYSPVFQSCSSTVGIGAAETRKSCGYSSRSEEHTSELQSRFDIVCRLLLEKKKYNSRHNTNLGQLKTTLL